MSHDDVYLDKVHTLLCFTVCASVGSLDRNVLIQRCIISSDTSDLIAFDTHSLFTEVLLLARSSCSACLFVR